MCTSLLLLGVLKAYNKGLKEVIIKNNLFPVLYLSKKGRNGEYITKKIYCKILPVRLNISKTRFLVYLHNQNAVNIILLYIMHD